MEKTKKTFQFQLILYNLLIIICIACAVSYYNYRSYKKEPEPGVRPLPADPGCL